MKPNHRLSLPATVLLAVLMLVGGYAVSDYAEADSPPVLDGLQFKNAKTPLEGVTSGGQPTEDEFRQAAKLGYKTVVNLRTDGEEIPFDEPALAEQLGMKYVHLPIAGAEGITSENAAALAEILGDAERPVLLHCGSGNRVGALFALDAHQRLGQDAETALQTGFDAGMTRLEPVVREKLGLPITEQE